MIRSLMRAAVVVATGAPFAMAWVPGMAEAEKPYATVSFSGTSAPAGGGVSATAVKQT
jgi:hypothetical protein